MKLNAESIEIHWDSDLLYAEGRLDSAHIVHQVYTVLPDSSIDTTTTAFDSTFTRGKPKMTDGGEVVVGAKMVYNIKSKRGKIVEGTTDFQDGKYYCDQIKKVDANVFNMRSGYYTTCTDEHPHYGFWAYDMKMIRHDKVVARPVVLVFGPVPVAIIPFGVFPASGGRHSGILMPRYGESASQGRFFTGLGYYWAPNDYYDSKMMVNYYERFGVMIRSDMNYAQRYVYSGGLSGSYINMTRSGTQSRGWDAQIRHSHQITPNTHLTVDAGFVSSGQYYQDVSRSATQRLQRNIRSNVTLSQIWPGTPYSASANLRRTQDLETGGWEQVLPQVAFSRGNSPLIPLPADAKPDSAKWFNNIFWSYGFGGINRASRNVKPETAYTPQVVTKDKKGGVSHSVNVTASQKPFGVLAVTPAINYSEMWVDEWWEFSQRANLTIDSVKHNSFKARRTFSTGIGLSTRLYGLFHPNILSVTAIRHTLSPGISFNWTPDFSKGSWGYYRVFKDAAGRKIYLDKFGGGVYGGTPKNEAMAVGIGVDNLFEYKRQVDGKEQKGELFQLSLATSNNLVADSMGWSPLQSSLRMNPLASGGSSFSGLGLDASMTQSFYAQKKVGTRYYEINKTAPNFLRLVRFELGTSVKVSGGDVSAAKDTTNRSASPSTTTDRFEPDEWTPSPAPWSIGTSLRYSEDHSYPDTVRRDAWADLTVELKATKNWKINSNIRVDLVNRKIVNTGITIYRDLHCWEGRLTWNPLGAYPGLYLNISVKSPQLKDVKIEKHEGEGGFIWGQ